MNLIVFVTNATELEKDHWAEAVVFGTIKDDPNTCTDENDNSAALTEKKEEKNEDKKEGCHSRCEPLHSKP